jgi:hypothetical protein
MSVYAHIETKLATREEIRALPVTGREEVFGVVGNTVFFSRAQEENSNEARPDAYLTMCVLCCVRLPAFSWSMQVRLSRRRRAHCTSSLAPKLVDSVLRDMSYSIQCRYREC